MSLCVPKKLTIKFQKNFNGHIFTTVNLLKLKLLKNKKSVIFGLPGAYTSVCSAKHLPGYVKNSEKYKEKGVDQIICISVNDPFVMNAWGKENNVGDKIIMMGGAYIYNVWMEKL